MCGVHVVLSHQPYNINKSVVQGQKLERRWHLLRLRVAPPVTSCLAAECFAGLQVFSPEMH